MKKSYTNHFPAFVGGLCILLLIYSCKKESNQPAPAVSSHFATLGLYELVSGTNRRIYIPIMKVGNQQVNYDGIFDTGSTGMTIDANGILPASMITNSGIQVVGPGDSVNVNGITVTAQQAVLSYGGIGGFTQEYGNLAYAPVTLGDQNGNITTTRIPIFMYYKVVNMTTGVQQPAHSNDVFGVGPGVSEANTAIASPLSYFAQQGNITPGFRLAMLNNGSFSTSGTFVTGLLDIGLIPDDFSSGFIMHPLTSSGIGGYSPNIPATVNYNGQDVPATVLFDTGTPSISLLEDGSAAQSVTTLPANTTVKLTTGSGFSYQYTTTSTYNLTQVLNPSYSSDIRTIFSIDFFISNEYLMDYKNHQIGLKNN
jgi:hypothetical protein